MNRVHSVLGPAVIGITILVVVMIWIATAGQDMGQLLESVGMSSQYQELLTSSNITLAMIGLMISFPLVVQALYRFPAIFWGLGFISFSYSQARFPAAIDAMMLGLRYEVLLAIVALSIYLCGPAGAPLSSFSWIGLLLCSWIVFVSAIHDATSSVPLELGYFLMFFALPVTVANLSMDPDYRHGIARGLYWSALGCLALNLLSLVSGSMVFESGRFFSFYTLPTNFANSFSLAACVLWAMTLWSASSAKKALFGCSFVAALALLFMSGTRNSMIGVALMVLLSLLLTRNRIAAFGALIASVLVAFTWIAVAQGLIAEHYLGRLGVSEHETRVTVWQSAIDLISKEKWLGYGPSLSSLIFYDVNSDQMTAMNPHNGWLGFTLRFGIVGVALLAALIAKLLFSLPRVMRIARLSDLAERPLLAVGVLWLAVLAVASLFEDNLSGRGTIQQLCFGCAIGLTACCLAVTQPRLESSHPPAATRDLR